MDVNLPCGMANGTLLSRARASPSEAEDKSPIPKPKTLLEPSQDSLFFLLCFGGLHSAGLMVLCSGMTSGST